MKVTISIDCTPAEAREFFGMPDIKPAQDVWLAEVEKKMSEGLGDFSPEGLAQSWLNSAATSAQLFPNLFGAALDNMGKFDASGKSKPKK